MIDFAKEIKQVTYKEVAIVWGSSLTAAANRLAVIRKTLNKKKFHRLTIVQYCKAEDISIDEFTTAINGYYQNLQKKAS